MHYMYDKIYYVVHLVRFYGTPKLRFSESRFSEILGLVKKSQLPYVFIPYTVSV